MKTKIITSFESVNELNGELNVKMMIEHLRA